MIWIKIKNNWTLLLLLLIYSCILFYHFQSIPFSHDELSAIERCKFGSIHELLCLGVQPDGHPAGVQLFLYFLIHCFGIHEWILKLPFIAFGIGSLFLMYRIAYLLFNHYAAITTSVIYIFLSYFLSQIVVARPYSPGLFFTLTLFLSGVKIKNKPERIVNYIWLSIGAIGAFYSHYFSFLQALLIIAGLYLFYGQRLHKHYFFISVGIAMLIFLPHIRITWHQLNMGGLEWLGKPGPEFFLQFFYHCFNNSYMLSTIAFLLLLTSFFSKCKSKKTKPLLLILFILPCIILYTYSIIRAPVLQYPALFFCTPFLLQFIGNGINIMRKPLRITIIILLSIFSPYLLIIQNNYYALRNYQPIEKFVINSQKLMVQNRDKKTLVIWNGNSKYLAYYLNKLDFKGPIICTDTLKNIRNINLNTFEALICNQLSPLNMFEINKTFPFIYSTEYNLLYSCMQLRRVETGTPLYINHQKLQFAFDTLLEWSKKSYDYKLDSLLNNKNYYLEFMPQLDSTIKGAELVLETYKGDERIDWRSVYLEPGNILSIKLKDVVSELEQHSIKIYIWNSAKKASKPIDVWMMKRKDNPLEYTFVPN